MVSYIAMTGSLSIDPDLGLFYLRVSTWYPFRLQFYFNGHNALARQLLKAQIAFEQIDNVFLRIADFKRTNKYAATFDKVVATRASISSRRRIPHFFGS